jgi:hypothetical protein
MNDKNNGYEWQEQWLHAAATLAIADMVMNDKNNGYEWQEQWLHAAATLAIADMVMNDKNNGYEWQEKWLHAAATLAIAGMVTNDKNNGAREVATPSFRYTHRASSLLWAGYHLTTDSLLLQCQIVWLY